MSVLALAAGRRSSEAAIRLFGIRFFLYGASAAEQERIENRVSLGLYDTLHTEGLSRDTPTEKEAKALSFAAWMRRMTTRRSDDK